MKSKPKIKIILKILFLIVIVTLVGAACAFGLSEHVKSATNDMIISPEDAAELDADCILVLGAFVRDEAPSRMLKDRLTMGINLYNLSASEKIIMSGDHGTKDYDEVNVMKDFAIEEGVPSEDVFMDHAGFSTYESVYRAKEIFKAEKIIIVTQKYHLFRALYTAKKLGLAAYGVPAEDIVYGGQAYREIREVLARNKDFFYSLFKPKPTFLGEDIPVYGDGNLTNDRQTGS